MTDATSQLEMFRRAITLLGGTNATAGLLARNPRTMRALYAGERELHDGWLRDVARLLIARADELRTLERALSPAFAGNLTDRQATAPRHGNRIDMRTGQDG